MKYHQCEWCEAIATRIFKTHDEKYIRYSCAEVEHSDWVRRLISYDGIAEWSERNSEVPFEIESPAAIPGQRGHE